MSTKTIEQFFTGKSLVIPGYQRDYAWTKRNVDDLFGDIEEALEVGGSHYMGTFILSQKDKSAPVHVVDGQQRLTTLTMLLDTLTNAVEDEAIKQHYRNTFIAHPVTGPKFRVLGENDEFFHRLLNGRAPAAVSDGQERLSKAHDWIQHRVNALRQKGGQDCIKAWLLCISQLEILEFIEPDEGKAIRMFQSVNDRGVPLAKMDIVKSLLVYYSNRYLDGVLDDFVSRLFGDAFRSFSAVKRLARESGYEIRNINRDSFREDDVLRYHYFAYDASEFGAVAGADYNATSETVLEVFLKPALSRLRAEPGRLIAFIKDYTEDLASFFGGLQSLVEATRSDRENYLLFVSQDLSATLYPLVIRLHVKGWLSVTGGASEPRSLLQLIELADLRVFKLRGTNPQADIARLTRDLPKLTAIQIAAQLRDFCQHFMPNALMAARITDEDLYRNPGVPRMLLEADELTRLQLGRTPLGIGELVALNRIGLTVEHILPQEPSFDVTAYGFLDNDEYLHYRHRLGNLILLEGPLNSACNNRTVEDKMSASNLYLASNLSSVKAVAAEHAGQAGFNKADLAKRGQALAPLIGARWSLN